jgi:hypothetical protein
VRSAEADGAVPATGLVSRAVAPTRRKHRKPRENKRFDMTDLRFMSKRRAREGEC